MQSLWDSTALCALRVRGIQKTLLKRCIFSVYQKLRSGWANKIHSYIFPLTPNSPLFFVSPAGFCFNWKHSPQLFVFLFLFLLLPSLQLGHPFSRRGDAAERLCLHPQGVWEPLRAGGGVRLPGVLYHLVPQQTGPKTAVAGVPGH